MKLCTTDVNESTLRAMTVSSVVLECYEVGEMRVDLMESWLGTF